MWVYHVQIRFKRLQLDSLMGRVSVAVLTHITDSLNCWSSALHAQTSPAVGHRGHARSGQSCRWVPNFQAQQTRGLLLRPAEILYVISQRETAKWEMEHNRTEPSWPTPSFPDSLVVMAVKIYLWDLCCCSLQLSSTWSFPASVLWPLEEDGLSGLLAVKWVIICSGMTSGTQSKVLLMKR